MSVLMLVCKKSCNIKTIFEKNKIKNDISGVFLLFVCSFKKRVDNLLSLALSSLNHAGL